MRLAKGFSIIELIVVIVLLGIVGVVIIPRFMSPSAFDQLAASDALIATVRAAQQSSLGRDDVTFEIDISGDDWVFAAKAGGNVTRSLEIPARNVVLKTGSAIASGDDTCATGAFEEVIVSTGPSDFELAFDDKGNLQQFDYDGNPDPPEEVNEDFNGVRICVNDSVPSSVCVSAAGYAYAGNCDD